MKITLATLPQATARQVFEQGKAHLLGQMKKSVKREGTNICLYRGPNGLKCGAGDFISDEEYDPEIEQQGWQALVVMNRVPKNHENLIKDIQMIHDSLSPEFWAREFDLLERRLIDEIEGF